MNTWIGYDLTITKAGWWEYELREGVRELIFFCLNLCMFAIFHGKKMYIF